MVTHDLSHPRKLPAVDRAERGGSIGMVLVVALALVAAAVGLLLIGRNNAQPYILALLSALAVVGVFTLFAGAAGILRLPGREGAHLGRTGRNVKGTDQTQVKRPVKD